MKRLRIAICCLLWAGISFAQTNALKQKAAGRDSFATAGKKVIVYTTADSTGLRITPTDTLHFAAFGQPFETQPCIFVDAGKTFQTFVGIGAALTDASAETYAKLPAAKQKEFMQSYFDPVKGIGFSLARTNIHSCDFSSGSYTYIAENDTALKTFSIQHDEQYRIPFIKTAIAAAGGTLPLFVSPWSPPAFMKTNNSMLQGGKLQPAFYQSWANYYIKFIKAYQQTGIPVWGLSVQNEPMAKQKWESCIFSAEEERDFIKNYLGPTLQKAGMANKKLIAWDHNRDLMYQRASTILNDPAAAKYVWGIGFHWYEDWTGGGKLFDNVKRVQEAYPNTHLIFTEGCAESFNFNQISSWKWGETYGRSMINDFNNGTVAWTDWNILLDEKGGPNHVGNFCFAPVHADTRTGELIYLNSFYYIGHFSKFIRPGAKRIISSTSRGQLLTTAFKNTDGSLAVVIMNQSNDKIPYNVWIEGKAVAVTSLPHSIQTVVIQ
ncbi:glycoside hydrolase family 30 protein [Limnovirga soli]|uniref:Glycosyl hydrolase n=1 Tax=Limnovirga soli TaxID=2656915 RepID=A0A8J8FGC0_9BACT|nr:glycoside hydrolase family 30 protein [Limnovirga soli]NNV55336.1 glycosyl hydrolase [Limnovirga soli]